MMWRSGLSFPLVAATLSLAGAADPAIAQLSTHAGYVVIQGSDTLAVERVASTGSRTEGELVLRRQGIRWRYAIERTADERVTSMQNAVFLLAARSDAPPAQSSVLTFTPEVAVAMIGGVEQRFPTRPGVVPFLNLSVGSLQQIVRRARVLGGNRVEVPVFIASGAQTMSANVERRGDTTSVELAGVRVDIAIDDAGEVAGAIVPAQGVRFIRASGAVDLGLPAPDYSAPPGAPYTAEDVVVRTAGGLSLAGTLTLPRVTSGHRVPAVITISGSGPQNRDSEIAIVQGYRPFRQIADTLGRRGIAVLRLDDRGIGGSDPGEERASSADLADDVRAAISWLRSRPEIDPGAIALVGHSEGGLIAPLIAESDTLLAGIVIMAGPAQTGREILAWQQRYAVELDTTIAESARDSVLASLRELTDRMAESDRWIAFFLEHDPLVTAMNVATPVLILHGETDRQVTADQAGALAEAFRSGGNRDVTMWIFPETNHLFLADPDGGWGGYATLSDSSVRHEVLGTLADWLHDRLVARGSDGQRK